MNAQLTLRSLSPLLYFVLIGFVLTGTIGLYHPLAVLTLSLGLASYSLSFFPRLSSRPLLPAGNFLVLLFFCILIFSALTAWRPNIFYPASRSLYLYFQSGLLFFGFAWGAFLLCQIRHPFSPQITARWLLAFLLAALYLRLFVLSLSPSPLIDVFTSGSLGADYLLSGLNPYTQKYPDIYGGAYSYEPCFLYSPVYLFLITPFRLLHDIRFASIAADALTAAALWRFGVWFKWKIQIRCAAILLWLTFPVSLFVLEQSWVDPLLVAASAWSILFLLEKKFLLLGLGLGLLCGIKLYGIFAAALIFLHLAGTHSFKLALRAALPAAALLLLAHLPFLLLDAPALFQSTIVNVMDSPLRNDALTLWSVLWNSLDLAPSKTIAMALFFLCLLFLAWRTLRRPGHPSQLTRSLVLCYSVLFLFGHQAFCNYYYYLAFFVLLDFLFSLDRPSPAGNRGVGKRPG